MKKKIFIVLICFTALSCKMLVSNFLENTIGKYIPNGVLYVEKNQSKIDYVPKIIVFITNNVSVNSNNKPLSSDNENYIKFLKSNINNDTIISEIGKKVVARYQHKEVLIKLDRINLHGKEASFPVLNKLPEKKYSFYEYRQLKEIYNADIVVQLELHQTIDIVDTLNGDFEYKLSSILDASYISTIDNSIIYNEDLKNNNAFFDKIPFFESNIQLQKTIKNSYIELTNIAIK